MKTLFTICCVAILSLSASNPTWHTTEDQEIKKFWKTLRTAVIGKNQFQVTKMTNFPVGNLICHDTELKSGMPAASKAKFKSCYNKIFTQCVRKHFIKNLSASHLKKNTKGDYQFVVDMKFKFPDGKPAGEGTVTFIFGKVNGQYKITQIMCVGGCGSDC